MGTWRLPTEDAGTNAAWSVAAGCTRGRRLRHLGHPRRVVQNVPWKPMSWSTQGISARIGRAPVHGVAQSDSTCARALDNVGSRPVAAEHARAQTPALPTLAQLPPRSIWTASIRTRARPMTDVSAGTGQCPIPPRPSNRCASAAAARSEACETRPRRGSLAYQERLPRPAAMLRRQCRVGVSERPPKPKSTGSFRPRRCLEGETECSAS